jgi:hypothetical protein
MKVASVIRIFAGLVGLAALAGSPACGQSEIDPDHFEGPKVEPLEKAKTDANGQIASVRYQGRFSLPYAVQCNGVSLRPGNYSVSLRSDGKIGHATLNQEGQTIGITGVIDRQERKQGDDALLVEHNGNTRKLSAIQVTELALVFDPQLKIEAPADSKLKRFDRLPLTATALKKEGRRAVPNAQNNQR